MSMSDVYREFKGTEIYGHAIIENITTLKMSVLFEHIYYRHTHIHTQISHIHGHFPTHIHQLHKYVNIINSPTCM